MECSVHGRVTPRFDEKGHARCPKCRSDAVQKRRRMLKLKAIEYKGGQCELCGYNRCTQALEFHHTDPSEKEFGLGYRGLTRSWGKIKEELDKCQLLCSNCHREVHAAWEVEYLLD
jgi:5-methylcytosine-specific restriction endonuclease McrA